MVLFLPRMGNGSLKSIKMEDGSVPTKNRSLKGIKMEDGSVPTKNGSLKGTRWRMVLFLPRMEV
jgi:hypothetical protein